VSESSITRAPAASSAGVLLPLTGVRLSCRYKLWKYTIFLLGFLTFGVPCAFLGAVDGMSASCVANSAAASVQNGDFETSDCSGVYIQGAISGIIGGIVGGFCFSCCYCMVILSTGCGCGIYSVYALVGVWAVWSVSNSDGVIDGAENTYDTASFIADHYEAISFASLIGGAVMAWAFWQFQKVCSELRPTTASSPLLQLVAT